jgi:hypothetical protein
VNDWQGGRRQSSGKRDDEDRRTVSHENCRGVADEEEYEEEMNVEMAKKKEKDGYEEGGGEK